MTVREFTQLTGSSKQSDHPESSQTRLKFGKEVQIRPPTYHAPLDSPRTSARQRAEQGVNNHFFLSLCLVLRILQANFLRTYIPDVEIPEELIRQQLIEDTTRSRELRKFDPYLGNLIDVFESKNKDDTIFAAFAAGETNQDLSKPPTSTYSIPRLMGLRVHEDLLL